MSSRVTSTPPMRLAIARRYLPPPTCWASPTRHVSRTSNANGFIFSKIAKRTIVPLGRSNPRAIAIPIASSSTGRHFTLHRHDQTQGDDRLRSLSAAQLLLETARTLSSPQSLRTNTEESFHPACDRRAGAAYRHRKSAQWSRTYTPFHAGGVGRESA